MTGRPSSSRRPATTPSSGFVFAGSLWALDLEEIREPGTAPRATAHEADVVAQRFPSPLPSPTVKMFTRAGRAAIFDKKVFTEAFFDDDAMADSAIVVALVGALTYVGFLVRSDLGLFDLFGLIEIVLYSVVSWLILGFATWFAASRLFNASGRPQTMIALQGLAVIPLLAEVLGTPWSWIGLLWYLGILVVATKQGSDLPYKEAGLSVLIGFAVAFVVRLLLGAPFALLGGAFF